MLEGRSWSRLPIMTESLQDYIKGTADFLGFNYYTSRLIEKHPNASALPPSWDKDAGIKMSVDPSWKRAKSTWIYSVPEGLREILKWIKKNYGNPPVLITENGWSDDGQFNDLTRIKYFNDHFVELSKAINVDGCNVMGHTVWSVIDNFEWLEGFS